MDGLVAMFEHYVSEWCTDIDIGWSEYYTCVGFVLTFYIGFVAFVQYVDGKADKSDTYLGINLAAYTFYNEKIYKTVMNRKIKWLLYISVMAKPILACISFMKHILINIKPIFINNFDNNTCYQIVKLIYKIACVFMPLALYIAIIFLMMRIIKALFAVIAYISSNSHLNYFKEEDNCKTIDEINDKLLKDIDKVYRDESTYLRDAVKTLLNKIEKDGGSCKYSSYYNKIIMKLLDRQIEKRERQIKDKSKRYHTKKKAKLDKMIDNEYTSISALYNNMKDKDSDIGVIIAEKLVKLYLLNIRMLQVENEFKDNSENLNSKGEANSALNSLECYRLIVNIYNDSNNHGKGEIIDNLGRCLDNDDITNVFEKFCLSCIKSAMQNEFDRIADGTQNIKGFEDIFSDVMLLHKDVYEWYRGALQVRFKEWNYNNVREAIACLTVEDKIELMVKMILSGLFKRFEHNWKFVLALSTIYEVIHGDITKENINASNRIVSVAESYLKDAEAVEYVRDIFGNEPVGKLMERYYSKSRNGDIAFCIFICRLCVEKRYSIYDYMNLDSNTKVSIISELSEWGDPVLNSELIKKAVNDMQDSFTVDDIKSPMFLITLESLIMSNIKVSWLISPEENLFSCSGVGSYLLINHSELTPRMSARRDIRERIRRDFIYKEMNVEQYIDYLNNVCKKYGRKINEIQLMSMRRYLLEIILS